MQGPNIYCIGRNYAEHAKELKNELPTEPVVFLKAAAALRSLGNGALAFRDETFHHEAEIVLRIGRLVELGSDGSWDDVDALALGIDLTRRDVQMALKAKGLPWTTAKSFAGAALLGEFVTASEFSDLDAITFTLKVNGELRQRGDSRDMLFKVPRLLSYLAQHHELTPGDLVYTGTPAGVGPLKRGDHFELEFTELKRVFLGRL